jgi:GTP diphosphokinase / guanosine-3',5'-bis(diphosphate) 3'-diphosphatase
LPPANTDQKRKGARAKPYVNHLVEVARLLADATSGEDPALVAAGLLHDTLEDTCTTFEELERVFGAEIAGLVQEVTDNKKLEKAERKRLQIETAGKKSPRARLIKIADKTSNLRSILGSPPTDWSTQRKREYFDWAAAVVECCRGVNSQLEEVFDQAYARGIAKFTIDAA